MTFETTAMWDKSKLLADKATRDIFLILFIIALLVIATFIFSINNRINVLDPIEKLMNRVIQLCENPLLDSSCDGSHLQFKDASESVETDLLLETIEKIGNLMRMGFGEAGLDIIASNLSEASRSNSTYFDVDRASENMLKGRPVVAIYGFCDIRNFTDITECLQDEV
jgi:hypothetical protein